MSERDQFGPGLRREREKRGISLKDIAARTKISASFFEALERNDFSRWPGGIFRRSFLRSYAESLGIDADRVVRDCTRLFPCDDEGIAVIAGSAAARAPREAAAAPSPRTSAPGHPTRSLWLGVCAIGATLLGVIVAVVASPIAGGPYLWVSIAAACVAFASAALLIRRRRAVRAAAEAPSRPEPRPAATVVRFVSAQAARQAPANHHITKRRGQVERFPRPSQRRQGKRGRPRV